MPPPNLAKIEIREEPNANPINGFRAVPTSVPVELYRKIVNPATPTSPDQ